MIWRVRRREAPLPEMLAADEAAEGVPSFDVAGRTEEAWVEEEWQAHVAGMAWRNIAGEFEERTRRVFEMLSKGRTTQEVATAIGLAPASVPVYKKRVLDRLRAEVIRLNTLLD